VIRNAWLVAVQDACTGGGAAPVVLKFADSADPTVKMREIGGGRPVRSLRSACKKCSALEEKRAPSLEERDLVTHLLAYLPR